MVSLFLNHNYFDVTYQSVLNRIRIALQRPTHTTLLLSVQ